MIDNLVLMLGSTFIKNALMAGFMFSVTAGLLGYFIIIRKMSFASHALSHISLPGAISCVLLGINPMIGLTVFCFGGGLFITGVKRSNNREIMTGTLLAFALAVSMYLSTLNAGASKSLESLLFGSIVTISTQTLWTFLGFTVFVVVIFLIYFKKLLLCSVNPDVATTKGVSDKKISFIFVVLLVVTTVMSIQILGALLPFAMLITPSATMLNWTANLKKVIGGSIVLNMVTIVIAVFVSIMLNIPTSFAIVSLAFGVFMISKVTAR